MTKFSPTARASELYPRVQVNADRHVPSPAPPAPASREARLEKALREISDRIARNDASHLGIEGIARRALEGDE